MCVIVHAEPKKTIEKKILQNCYDHNSHGWGIMWAEDGKIFSVKDVSNFDDFYKHWKDVPRHVQRGVHFRIRTHGGTNKQNCHPFQPREDIALMHNGIISSTPLIEAEMSDTYNFCMYEVAPIIEGWDEFIKDEAFKSLMEDVTGYSKLLFINSQGESLRTKESMWHEQDGIYYSNKHSTEGRYNANNGVYNTTYKGSIYDGFRRDQDEDFCDLARSRAANASRTNNVHTLASGALSSVEPKKKLPSSSAIAIEDWRNKERRGIVQKTIEEAKEAEQEVISEQNGKSDLYSGNKTDAEGRDYVERLEQEQIADMLADEEALARAFGPSNINEELEEVQTEIVNPFPQSSDTEIEEETDEAEPEIYFDVEEILAMEFGDVLDMVQDYPKSTAFTLKALVDTCAMAGIFKIKVPKGNLS